LQSVPPEVLILWHRISKDGLGADHSIRLWDISTGNCVEFAPDYGHNDWVTALIFCDNGRHLVSGGRDHQILVWTQDSDINNFVCYSEV
jgi:WD40 repeat protein